MKLMKGGSIKMSEEKIDIVATGPCVMCGRTGEVKVYETKEVLCKYCYQVNCLLRKGKNGN